MVGISFWGIFLWFVFKQSVELHLRLTELLMKGMEAKRKPFSNYHSTTRSLCPWEEQLCRLGIFRNKKTLKEML